MRYAYIKDNKVERVGELPKSYENMSNFYLMGDEIIKEHSFLPVEYTDKVELNLDQYYGSVEYVIETDRVVASYPVITRTVDEVKTWMIERGKGVAEYGLQNDYSLLYIILGLSGKLGTAYKTSVEASITKWIGLYNTFVGEVNACTTKAQLLVVWNKYPSLQESDD